ncbi:MAG: (d)CMP kinase, partial [Phycisphaerales bacterium]
AIHPPHSARPIIITIDGPAGTGKSSVARALAKRLGLDFLDTGAMYRAAAAVVIDRQLPFGDSARVVAAIAEADIHFDWKADPPRVIAFGEAMDGRVRSGDVTAIVSQVASIPELRRHLVAKQRLIAAQHRKLVTEGRDQGSVAFPDAALKLYLDAAPRVRARRRAEQLRAAGMEADEAALEREIAARDHSDSHRPTGPLVCPEDAIRVDTSDLSFEQVVDRLEALCRERVEALA